MTPTALLMKLALMVMLNLSALFLYKLFPFTFVVANALTLFPCIYHFIVWQDLEDKAKLLLAGSLWDLPNFHLLLSQLSLLLHVSFNGNYFLILFFFPYFLNPWIGHGPPYHPYFPWQGESDFHLSWELIYEIKWIIWVLYFFFQNAKSLLIIIWGYTYNWIYYHEEKILIESWHNCLMHKD